MDLQKLFYPKKIAVVGASPNLASGKLPFYQVLQSFGYPGKLYPVNPVHKEIDGTFVYPTIDDLPEGIDLAIVSVPVREAFETLKAAVRKGIKFVHFFTSGFSETGNIDLERSMVEMARASGTRIIGPNCLGIVCTESRVNFNFLFKQEGRGKVAFLAQSGGVSENFIVIAQSRQIEINKLVSYGNQIDLRVEDYLEYFAEDDGITAVGAYIEDVKDGKRFLNALKKTTIKKPVVVLKGGMTEEGAKAAASHTGAMAVKQDLFSAVLRQQRCIEVQSLSELIDVLMIGAEGRLPQGPRLGYLGAGGGASVIFTDLAAKHGLQLPELSAPIKKLISERISSVNTSAANPVDLGAQGIEFDTMAFALETMDKDDNLDVLIPYFIMEYVSIMQAGKTESGTRTIIDTIKKMKKPVVPILFSSVEDDLTIEKLRIKMFREFRKESIPVYKTMEDAVCAIKGILKWTTFDYLSPHETWNIAGKH